MPSSNNPFVNGAVISESDVKSRLNDMEVWVNGGAVAGDLAHGEWVKKGHILRPEFVGGSDDRAEFCTGTVRYRTLSPDKVGAEVFHAEARAGGSGSGKSNWEVVNGLNVTVKVYRPMLVIYSASWLAWETGSPPELVTSGSAPTFHPTFIDIPPNLVANFALYTQKIDGTDLTQYGETRRALYNSLDRVIGGYTKRTGKQMSIHHVLSLTAGIYNIGVRCYAQGETGGTATNGTSQNIFVRARSCVVDTHFSQAT